MMIDDRGRLFGAMNVVDALLLVFVLAVVPLGFVAYKVFRVPTPRIERVEPASQPLGRDLRIRLIGRDLRPYLRVLVNRTGEPLSVSMDTLRSSQAQILVETPTLAEALLPVDVGAGSYDLHVFDGTREILTMPAAFSLLSPSSPLDILARFPVEAGLVGLVHPGDQDMLVTSNGRAASPIGYAQMVSVRALDQPAVAFVMHSNQIAVQMAARMLEAVLRVPAAKNESGVWEYRKQPVRAGDPFIFDTAGYVLYGVVGDVRGMTAGGTK